MEFPDGLVGRIPGVLLAEWNWEVRGLVRLGVAWLKERRRVLVSIILID